MQIQVRNKHTRFNSDGETGVLVLAGTCGMLAAVTIHNKEVPRLTVFWDAVAVQTVDNKEPTQIMADWEESNIWATEVEYVARTVSPDDTTHV